MDLTDVQASVSQTAGQDWNKLPLEILGLILSNLGKHDLLESRLVSRFWNDECLKVSRKSKFTQTLRTSNIGKYVNRRMWTVTNSRQFVLPYHLNFDFYFNGSESDDPMNLESMLVSVVALCQLFGAECVSEMTLTTDEHSCNSQRFKELGLWELLTLISPGLKSLDLKGFDVNVTGILSSMSERNMKFPNLRKMSCNTRKCESGTRGPGPFYISLIEKSPHLEELVLTHPCDLESWPLRFNVLKSLTLDIILKPSNILNKLRSCPSPSPPILRELCFKHHVALAPVVYDILDILSPTLKSIAIKKPHRDESSKIPALPTLPHLKHIGFEYDDNIRVNPRDINFNPHTLPSLTSVELPIGFFNSEEIGIEFPTVNELKLTMSSYHRGNDANYYAGALEQLQQIFPTPLKFCIVNGLKQYLDSDCSGVKYLLARLTQSNWSQNIREFEMNGFHEDYFGEVLEQLEFHPRIVLEGCGSALEKSMKDAFQNAMSTLKVESEDYTSGDGVKILQRLNPSTTHQMQNIIRVQIRFARSSNIPLPTRSEPPPKLTSMAKYLPHLRGIQISEPLSHQEVWREQIQELTSHFPHIIVSVT